MHARVASPGRNGGQREREGDELLRRQLTLERAPVVLVGIPEDVSPVAAELARRCVQHVDARDDERPRRRPREPGEHSHEGRLPRTARAEHDADLCVATDSVRPWSAATPPDADG